MVNRICKVCTDESVGQGICDGFGEVVNIFG